MQLICFVMLMAATSIVVWVLSRMVAAAFRALYDPPSLVSSPTSSPTFNRLPRLPPVPVSVALRKPSDCCPGPSYTPLALHPRRTRCPPQRGRRVMFCVGRQFACLVVRESRVWQEEEEEKEESGLAC